MDCFTSRPIKVVYISSTGLLVGSVRSEVLTQTGAVVGTDRFAAVVTERLFLTERRHATETGIVRHLVHEPRQRIALAEDLAEFAHDVALVNAEHLHRNGLDDVRRSVLDQQHEQGRADLVVPGPDGDANGDAVDGHALGRGLDADTRVLALGGRVVQLLSDVADLARCGCRAGVCSLTTAPLRQPLTVDGNGAADAAVAGVGADGLGELRQGNAFLRVTGSSICITHQTRTTGTMNHDRGPRLVSSACEGKWAQWPNILIIAFFIFIVNK